jgi:hypothetical protein
MTFMDILFLAAACFLLVHGADILYHAIQVYRLDRRSRPAGDRIEREDQ